MNHLNQPCFCVSISRQELRLITPLAHLLLPPLQKKFATLIHQGRVKP
jgi:hypothetical protein